MDGLIMPEMESALAGENVAGVEVGDRLLIHGVRVVLEEVRHGARGALLDPALHTDALADVADRLREGLVLVVHVR